MFANAGNLKRCGLLRATTVEGMLAEFKTLRRFRVREPLAVVVELPRIYSVRHWKGDPNDLLDVAAVAGAAATLGEPRFVTPQQWKGRVPKPIHHKRIRAVLSADELAVFVTAEDAIPKSLAHNVLDAIGIGLWAKGRMDQ